MTDLRISRRLVPVLSLAAGLMLVFHRQILTGLQLMQTVPYDVRHLNYVLEHGYRWATGWELHGALWSPPVFHPVSNTAAYSETLIGLVPFYAPWRLSGLAPDTSMQLFSMLLAALNFVAAHLFLRRCVGTGVVASSTGAFLFSFAGIRAVKLGHLHLMPQFFTLGAIYALVRLFRTEGDARGRSKWVWLFCAAVVAQLYAGFYLAWFLGFGLALAALWALALPSLRAPLLARLREQWRPCAAAAALSALAVLPMAVPHLKAARLLGMREYHTVDSMLLRPQAWVNHGQQSWLYGDLHKLDLIHGMPLEWEQRFGMGLVAPMLALYGLWRGRRRPLVQVLILATATLLLLATRWPGGFSLWRAVYELVPGAAAIRAVARIGLMALIPASLGLAIAVDDLRRRWSLPLLGLIGVLCFLEQGQTRESYSKQQIRDEVAALARRIPDDCGAFYYSPVRREKVHVSRRHLDAMWASLTTEVPTVNGYSSNLPPGWGPLLQSVAHTPERQAAVREHLERWSRSRGIERLCWIKTDPERPGTHELERLRSGPETPAPAM
ncbi:MAG: hypothetical protein GY719_19880 [bacterium]|nr:hypothetical protein [bacterium]